MTADQLRKSILQQAIQGKLVPQDPKDEPASVLLERIREEKAYLIKEKKAKREKNPSRIFRGEDNSYYEEFTATGEVRCIDDEIPFDLPDGWAWGRGRTLFLPMESTRPSGEAFIYIDVDAVNNQTHRVDNPKRILTVDAPSRASRKLHESDVLFSMVRPYLRNIALISKELSDAIASTGFYVITPSVGIYSKFLYYLVLSPYVVDGINAFMKGENSPSVNNGHIENFIYPLPPLAEQERIVAKIEELMPWVEQYGKAQSELDQLNNSLQGRLRKSILQYAIEGKLVPQQAEDGSAEELLAEIQAEKQRLYAAGKLKKKDLAHSTIFRAEDGMYYEQVGKTITCINEEIPFDLPDGWVWGRGRTLFLPMESTRPSGEAFIYIDVDAVNNQTHRVDNPKRILTVDAPSRASRKLHESDVLFSMVRPYLRNIALISKELSDAIASTGFYVITPSVGIYSKFLYYLVLSPYVVDGINAFMKGENSPSVNNGHIENFIYPLPPLTEQQRIVSKIEEVLGVLNRLGQ